MGNYLDVQVLDPDGEPITGVEVKIGIDGIFSGGFLEEFTDDEGHASFETADEYEPSRHLTIYVRGQSFGPYDIGGGSYTVRPD